MSGLTGIRIAVTRAAEQADELAGALRDRGAEVVVTPLIRIEPRIDEGEVRAAIADLPTYEWIVFTSVNGVDLFMQALRSAGREIGKEAGVACVGPATAAAAARHGLRTSVIPDEYVGHAIADALAAHVPLQGARILLARAEGGSAELPERLSAGGATVVDIRLYRTVADAAGSRALRAELERGALDVITFTSGSTIRYFNEMVGTPGRAKVAVIGPVTAEAARKAGMKVDIVAVPHTAEGIVGAIAGYFEENRK
jgi:uroporphyrinogen-III synthase